MVGLPHTVLPDVGKPVAAARSAFSGTVGGLFGGTAKKAVGVNPYDEVIGVVSKALIRPPAGTRTACHGETPKAPRTTPGGLSAVVSGRHRL